MNKKRMGKKPVCALCGSDDVWKYSNLRRVFKYEWEEYTDGTREFKWVRYHSTTTNKHKCKNNCTSRNRKGDIGYTTLKWVERTEKDNE